MDYYSRGQARELSLYRNQYQVSIPSLLFYSHEKLSVFIDHYIKPHVLSLPSYVQDDMDFLRKVESVNADGPLPPTCYFAP